MSRHSSSGHQKRTKGCRTTQWPRKSTRHVVKSLPPQVVMWSMPSLKPYSFHNELLTLHPACVLHIHELQQHQMHQECWDMSVCEHHYIVSAALMGLGSCADKLRNNHVLCVNDIFYLLFCTMSKVVDRANGMTSSTIDLINIDLITVVL